ADPQVQHLEMAQPAAALGDLTILGHPVSFGDKRLPLQNAAPALGEHNEEILTSLGYTREQMSIGKIKPLFTPSHLPASAHPLPPGPRWRPRPGATRPPCPPWHTPGQGVARSAPRRRRARAGGRRPARRRAASNVMRA